jgi:hypothetical protein
LGLGNVWKDFCSIDGVVYVERFENLFGDIASVIEDWNRPSLARHIVELVKEDQAVLLLCDSKKLRLEIMGSSSHICTASASHWPKRDFEK